MLKFRQKLGFEEYSFAKGPYRATEIFSTFIIRGIPISPVILFSDTLSFAIPCYFFLFDVFTPASPSVKIPNKCCQQKLVPTVIIYVYLFIQVFFALLQAM